MLISDANKRTALAVMLSFLETQGISIKRNTKLDDIMVAIVESKESHEQISLMLAHYLYSNQA